MSDEAVDISMSKVMGQDDRLELVGVLDDELFAGGEPVDDGGVLGVLSGIKRYGDDLVAFLHEVGDRGFRDILDHNVSYRINDF